MSGSRSQAPIDDDGDDTDVEDTAGRAVATIVRLAANEEACRLLGVDGTLEDEVDVDFAVEPIGYVAREIARALTVADEGEADDRLSLSALVALVRLYRTTTDGFIDETGLQEAVIDLIRGDDDDEDYD